MRPYVTLAMLAAASLAACGRTAETETTFSRDKEERSVVKAETTSADRSTTFETRIDESKEGVRIRVAASGIPVGAHGMHVHEIGRCDGPAFTSAGAHWNPTAREHGRDNPAGAHLGDAANLVVGPDGSGSAEFVIAGASLTRGPHALYDDDGAALLIHAAPDDYRTDPSGGSGDRILCSVLKAAK